jgi:hypothetical protein
MLSHPACVHHCPAVTKCICVVSLLQGAAAMLAVLPCLQELRVLQLSPGLLVAPHAPTEQYSALTSSRHLTFVCLYHCQLPAGAAGGGCCQTSELSSCFQ